MDRSLICPWCAPIFSRWCSYLENFRATASAGCSWSVLTQLWQSMFPWTSTRWPARQNPIQPQNVRGALLWLRGWFKHAGAYRSPSWCHTIVLPPHLNSVTQNSSENTTYRQFLSTVQSWTIDAHLRLAALILLLVRGFHLAIRPFRPPACNLKQSKNVVINIIESNNVVNSLIIIGKWTGSFCLCAIFDISTYLPQNVEMETTRFSVGCHSVRTVLAVTWRCLRTISFRYVSFLAVVARGHLVRKRSRWDLLCCYLRMVLLTLLWLQRSWRAICLWDMPVLCRARAGAPFLSTSFALCP